MSLRSIVNNLNYCFGRTFREEDLPLRQKQKIVAKEAKQLADTRWQGYADLHGKPGALSAIEKALSQPYLGGQTRRALRDAQRSEETANASAFAGASCAIEEHYDFGRRQLQERAARLGVDCP